ncbi:acyl-CoA dehydrogenase family protein [Kribbella turkmenica]|uniref:acyl-CoA dehydrogenase family protein n=1 Tax=Kribbella turkmenica TaxID=2530375 RepID=UPI0026BEF829|nr:acyl-CoA dehydrogenase family protein [Kribbella turkmenica]
MNEWERAGELPRDLHDKAGQWVCDQALQLHGGLGYMRGAEVERQYRDQKILAIGGGTTEILTGLAAGRLGFST